MISSDGRTSLRMIHSQRLAKKPTLVTSLLRITEIYLNGYEPNSRI